MYFQQKQDSTEKKVGNKMVNRKQQEMDRKWVENGPENFLGYGQEIDRKLIDNTWKI